MNIPDPPLPPPIRTFKETFWNGLVETKESIEKTKKWKKYIKELNISHCGYMN